MSILSRNAVPDAGAKAALEATQRPEDAGKPYPGCRNQESELESRFVDSQIGRNGTLSVKQPLSPSA